MPDQKIQMSKTSGVVRRTITRWPSKLTQDHKLPCSVCGGLIQAGQYPCLIPAGPGEDHEARRRAREGRPYNAVALIAHWACVSGEEDE